MSAGTPPLDLPVTVRPVGPEAAADVLDVVRRSFEARPPLDPPAAALSETVEHVAAVLDTHGGLVAECDGRVVGSLLRDVTGDGRLFLRRVGVLPELRDHGVASHLVEAAVAGAAADGYAEVAVLAREELPGNLRFWAGHGFVEVAREHPYVELVRQVGVRPEEGARGIEVPDGPAMQDLGRRLAADLRAGDLLVLSGGLGAGKTTFTQGLGEGLGVRGPVTSPTFVIARVHPSLVDGPPLVHVDAYRLGGVAELDDLDLDTDLADAVTVVEWGEGLAEGLADSRVEVRIERATGGSGSGPDRGPDADRDDPRVVRVAYVGPRWAGRAGADGGPAYSPRP